MAPEWDPLGLFDKLKVHSIQPKSSLLIHYIAIEDSDFAKHGIRIEFWNWYFSSYQYHLFKYLCGIILPTMLHFMSFATTNKTFTLVSIITSIGLISLHGEFNIFLCVGNDSIYNSRPFWLSYNHWLYRLSVHRMTLGMLSMWVHLSTTPIIFQIFSFSESS